jgi:dTDP-4-amino-4,6-dideoxygalactose transaminase
MDRFLMDLEALADRLYGKYALILSELYGHTYDLAALNRLAKERPALRIIDMAMTVPTEPLLGRMERNDFAVVSFGMGKCLYAGWGGVAFTRDGALANEVRRLRDLSLVPGNVKLSFERIAQISFRTAVHNLGLYGLGKKLHGNPSESEDIYPRHERRSTEALPVYWKAPSTYLDRRLILHNLRLSHRNADLRCAQASRYREHLQNVNGVTLPEHSQYPLSFFTVRVRAENRSLFQNALSRRGISVGTLFGVGSYLSSELFPNAHCIAREVLNLPINTALKDNDIDRICESIDHCLSHQQFV